MSTLIKLVILIFGIVFLYGFVRPLAVSTYCRSHVGTGGGSSSVNIDQALNAEAAKSQQDQDIQDCIKKTLPNVSIQPVEDLFHNLASPNTIPGVNGH